MLKSPRRQNHSASRANTVHSRKRALTTKRRGEIAELAFVLKAASLGFGVSKRFGDSERYDTIVDSRNITKRPCNPRCELLRSLVTKHKGKAKPKNGKQNPDAEPEIPKPKLRSRKPGASTPGTSHRELHT